MSVTPIERSITDVPDVVNEPLAILRAEYRVVLSCQASICGGDIPVEDDPAQIAKGTDPQLERAIQEVMKRIAAQPPAPKQPPYEKRVPKK